MKAVVDRIVGDVAVLLVGDKEVKVDFPKKLLPSGTKEGSWLKVSFELDPKAEKEQRSRIAGKLDRLKNK